MTISLTLNSLAGIILGCSENSKKKVWITLVPRSNGQTNRSVKTDGKWKVRQVVVLRIIFTAKSDSVIVGGSDVVRIEGGSNWGEITSDEKLTRTFMTLDGGTISGEKMNWGESVIMQVHVNVDGCKNEREFRRIATRVCVDGINVDVEETEKKVNDSVSVKCDM